MQLKYDFDQSRRPRRFRLTHHKDLLAEFIGWLGGNYYAENAKVVTLSEWDISPEVVMRWARIRHFMHWVLMDGPEIPIVREDGETVPLFLIVDEVERRAEVYTPTDREVQAARRDLEDAIGARVALLRTKETPVEYV